MPRLAALLALLLLASAARGEDWREFRGPTGQGLYAGKGVPVEWDTTKNVVWKEAIPGHGWSSPILLKGRVYLTTFEQGSGKIGLQALCLDAATGKRLWQKEVFAPDAKKSPGIHSKNSHASPTPVTDGERLYVHFGHQGTAALSLDGQVLWSDNKTLRYAPVHGPGGSPILAAGKLVFSADGSDKQFVVALDPATGDVAWKTDRKSQAGKKFSFSTPLLIDVAGKQQIVSPASGALMAYDAADGKELWRVKYDGYSVIPRPVYGHGMIFFSSGYDYPKLLAVRVDGKGDVTKTHVAWSTAKGAPHTPSPLLVGDELYTVGDHGTATCFDARTGKVHWSKRLEEAYSASPTYADGKVYFQSEDGVTTVVRAGKEYALLATNRMDERTYASFAVADGAIYLRTEGHLYRIGAT